MQLSKPQLEVSNSKSRWRVVASGRRWGKSFLSLNEMAKFARFPNARVLYVAPTYRQAKTVIWDELKQQLLDRKWVKRINESDLSIRLVNNSLITVRSSDNYEALRGGKYNFIVLDECGDIDPACWYQVLRPTLSDMGGHALFIGSPKGRNWFYDLWLQGGVSDDWSSWQFTTLQGGNVPEAEIEAARRDLDARTFEQEYEAKFVSYSGVIFYSFNDENMSKWQGFSDERTPLHIGVDFNRSPLCAVVATKDKNSLHIFDEIEIYSSNTNELCEEIRNRYGYNRQIFVYPDATGKRLTTNSGGVSDHIILNNAGFKLMTDAANPPVADTIASVNALMCNTKSERNLFIDPKCKRLRECILKYTYKEGTKVPDKDNGFDHMADALRYVVHKLFPIQVIPQQGVMGKPYRSAGRML